MELIEHYQPEFVVRFAALAAPCQCPACQNGEQGWPRISVKMKNQQRESLDMRCETAAREMLLNPQAFILHTTEGEAQSEEMLSEWSETLSQHCINLAIHPALTPQLSLYAIGVLLSKAQQYQDGGECDPALIAAMGEQLATLAEQGVLAEQFTLLPPVVENRLAALKAMGQMRLNLNLPLAEKMGIALKLSELAIVQPTRLAERLTELEAIAANLPLFAEQPHILRNALIYQLYNDVFPGIRCANYGEALLALAERFFRINMLCAIRSEQGALTADDVVLLLSALAGWQQQNPFVGRAEHTPDHSLLCGLSLL
ncbi:hypothetical protein [Intestinirhabdus alba]|jgi:lysine-N-methylase|uniref:Lysine-N-methylase n=1 Tax=Intestinirhabdus alba TaxID=2899544 RepID=A0A6L6IN43_9ENTR|nr:hypothetical protein [Intestinirhabdus alba]MTH46153.1 hypothetical protein [Intestinirhabdus alba]